MKRTLLLPILVLIGLGLAYPRISVASGNMDHQDLKRMVGQSIMVGFNGTTVEAPGFRIVLENLERGIIGGVLILPQNIAGKSELEAMVTALKQCVCETPPLIAIDEEGGTVDWLGVEHGFPRTASAAEIGKSNEDEARHQYKALAKKLAGIGFNLNFGPVVDLNLNPNNPIIGVRERSFSADAGVVTKYAKIFIEEHHAQNILTALKHFPGHGSSVADTHTAPADVSLTWSPDELIPYKLLIEAGMADMIMAGHLTNNARWGGTATQQGATAISQILRRDLGYNGVVVSDDLTMKALANGRRTFAEVAGSAAKAGIDLFVVAHPVAPEIENTGLYVNSVLLDGIQSGDISLEIVTKAWERMIALKSKLTPSERPPGTH